MEKCILSIPYRPILGEVVRDILFCDSSIHSALFRVVCTTAQALEVSIAAFLTRSQSCCISYSVIWMIVYDATSFTPMLMSGFFFFFPVKQKLYVSRLYDPMEIEGLQLAICSVLDILSSMLSYLSKVHLTC